MVDTVTGRVTQPCPECDLQDGSLNFSNGGQLAVIARRDGATWETAKAHILMDGELAAQATSKARSEIIVWSGENLLVKSQGSVWSGLLASSATKPRYVGEYSLAAASGGIVWLSNAEGLWRVGPSLEPKKVAGADHPIVDLDFLDANSTGIRRFRRPEAPLLRRFGAQSDRINFGFKSDSPTMLSVSRGSQILAVSDKDKSAITFSTDAHGVGRLYFNSSNSPPRLIDTISARLAEVIPPKAIPLKRRIGEKSAVDWLLVPDGTGPFPLVIHPYQGTTYGDDLPSIAKSEGLSPVFKPSILVANGYAVLLPSIPDGSERSLHDTLIQNLDEAVDAVLSTGLIDASRMAIHGHSYGGINALTIATRSTRYRAVISSSAIGEFAAAYGSVSPSQKVSFLGGPPLSANIAWYETGQGRFEAAPWSNPERYIRASSFFATDKIQAPLLLIAAEFDYFPMEQAEHLFVSLARLGKDASLLRLYGDGHIRHSPGNIRYEWDTILTFLNEKMPPAINASAVPR